MGRGRKKRDLQHGGEKGGRGRKVGTWGKMGDWTGKMDIGRRGVKGNG